jgi:hypothetical protein
MNSATIKLFLPGGDAKGLRTAEIMNWTGFAIAAPRTELDQLLQRDELDKTGIYILTGTDPLSGSPRAYIGEAEVIRDRLKQHKSKEFWISAIVFVSKDENLTKAHVRYLESRLLTEATQAGRFTLEQNQAGGSKLPESDRADMEVFLSRIQQLLPVLGSDLLIPIAQASAKPPAWRRAFLPNQRSRGTRSAHCGWIRCLSRLHRRSRRASIYGELSLCRRTAQTTNRERHTCPEERIIGVYQGCRVF